MTPNTIREHNYRALAFLREHYNAQARFLFQVRRPNKSNKTWAVDATVIRTTKQHLVIRTDQNKVLYVARATNIPHVREAQGITATPYYNHYLGGHNNRHNPIEVKYIYLNETTPGERVDDPVSRANFNITMALNTAANIANSKREWKQSKLEFEDILYADRHDTNAYKTQIDAHIERITAATDDEADITEQFIQAAQDATSAQNKVHALRRRHAEMLAEHKISPITVLGDPGRYATINVYANQAALLGDPNTGEAEIGFVQHVTDEEVTIGVVDQDDRLIATYTYDVHNYMAHQANLPDFDTTGENHARRLYSFLRVPYIHRDPNGDFYELTADLGDAYLEAHQATKNFARIAEKLNLTNNLPEIQHGDLKYLDIQNIIRNLSRAQDENMQAAKTVDAELFSKLADAAITNFETLEEQTEHITENALTNTPNYK